MRLTLTEKNGTLVQKIINEKNDTGYDPGDTYGNRFLEYDSPDVPVVGKKYFVWSRHYIGPNRDINDDIELRWSDDAELIENGMGGNSNRTIKRFHGWRGTTDDVHIDALGVRTCTEATRTEYQKTVHYKIVFGADECADLD